MKDISNQLFSYKQIIKVISKHSKSSIMSVLNRLIQKISEYGGLTESIGHHFYCRHLDGESVVIDLGANKFLFSLFIASQYGSRVIAIEPCVNLLNDSNFNDRITIVCDAIGDKEDTGTMYITDNTEANSMCWAISQGYTDKKVERQIKTLRFSTLLEQFGIDRVDLLKIDIEGAERLLFNSTSDKILNQIAEITIEFHDFAEGAITMNEVSQIKARLALLGFREINLSTPGTNLNVLFLNGNIIKLGLLDRTLLLRIVPFLIKIRELVHKLSLPQHFGQEQGSI